jgi:O-antigen ligase
MRVVAFWLSLVFVFTIPWEEVVRLGSFGTIGRLVGVLLAGFWVFTVVATNKIRKPHPFHAIFFLFIVWHVLSVLWTIDVNGTVGRLQAYIQLVVMVYIIWDLYITPTAVMRGLQAYVLGAYVAIGSLMSNYFAGTQVYYGRFSATGFDANNIGIIMALGVAPAWYLATVKSQSKITTLLKLVNYIYIPSAVLATLLTGSRGALLAISFALLFVISGLTRLGLFSRIAVIVLFIGALFVLQPLIPLETLQRLGTTRDSIEARDLNGRYHIWEEGFSAFRERPLLGVGSFAFRASTDTGKVAHNSFLTILVEVGLVGFGLFAIIMAITVYHAIQHKKWEAALWLVILVTLVIGISSLNWAHRKQLWLFPSFVVASASLAIKANNQRPRTKDYRQGYNRTVQGSFTWGQPPTFRPSHLVSRNNLQGDKQLHGP